MSEEIVAAFLAHCGPGEFDRFLAALEGPARAKQRLLFWQEQLWRAFTREVPSTYADVSKALEGARPVAQPAEVERTPEQFVAHLLACQTTFIEIAATAIAQTSRDVVRAMNTDQLIGSYLSRGLIKWRHAVERPEDDLRRALAIAREAETVELPPHIDRGDPVKVAFLGLLLEGAPDLASLARIQAVGPFERFAYRSIHLHVARCVLGALGSPVPASEVEDLLAALAKHARLGLFRSTTQAQLALIAARDGPGAVDAALALGDLYRKRARSEYFAGGAMHHGGGPDNPHVVDFELAALVRWCGPDLEEQLRSRGFLHVRCWS